MSDLDKITKMSRKELNAEVAHCWREQEQLCKTITELESQLRVAVDGLNVAKKGLTGTRLEIVEETLKKLTGL